MKLFEMSCSELVELRSRTSVELDNLRGKISELNVAAERRLVEMKDLKAEEEVREEELRSRAREVREKTTALEAAQRLVLELREEGTGLKERLVAVEREQDRLDKEKTEAETVITEEKRISSSTAIEVQRIKKREEVLIEQVRQQETEDRKLREELVTGELAIAALKEEIIEYERRLGEKETEMARLRLEVQERLKAKEDSDTTLKKTRKERNELSNQITSITLKKDALEDEAVHLRIEVQELREQIEVVQLQLVAAVQGREQMGERLNAREREVKDMKGRLETAELEVEREVERNEDWRVQLEAEESRGKELRDEIKRRNEEIDDLNRQVIAMKTKVFEMNRKASEQQEEQELNLTKELKKMGKKVKQAKDENSQQVREHEEEVREMQERLETRRQDELAKLSTSFNQERERLEEEVDFLTQQVETLRNRSNESILIAENSRSTAERLAKSEEGLSSTRIIELTSTVDSLRKELITERREGSERLAKEHQEHQELQIELRKAKNRLEEETSRWKEERDMLNLEVEKVKEERRRHGEEVSTMRGNFRNAEEALEISKRKLAKTEKEKEDLNETIENHKVKIHSLEERITERNQKLQNTINDKHREVDTLEKKVEVLEKSEKTLINEIEEVKMTQVKNTFDETDSVFSENRKLQNKITEISLELEILRRRDEVDNKGFEDIKIAELKRRLDDEERRCVKLEEELAEERRESELDMEAKESQVVALQESLIELRERERR